MIDRIVTSIGDRREAILDVIRGAERRLLLSLFRCNDEGVFDELRQAVARGVAVEVLTTARAKGGRARLETLWGALARTGASVHMYADPVVKYHAKYLVADEGPAVVTSLNFTRKCFNRTWDAVVITHDPTVVTGLQRLFAADCAARPLTEPLTSRLIVGPEWARRQLTELIVQARQSIRLIDAKLSDPDLLTLLAQRRDDGVRVDVVTAKHVGGLKSHGKIMLVDGTTAVVGSLALAALSLEFRREVAITLEGRDAIAGIEQFFSAIQAAEAGGSPPAVSG